MSTLLRITTIAAFWLLSGRMVSTVADEPLSTLTSLAERQIGKVQCEGMRRVTFVSDQLELLPIIANARCEEGVWWLDCVSTRPGPGLSWWRERIDPRDDGPHATISAEPPIPLYVPPNQLTTYRMFRSKGFAFVVFATSPEELQPASMVYRRNPPGWTWQPYASVKQEFLESISFAKVERKEDRPILRIVNGCGRRVAEYPVSDATVPTAGLHDWGRVVKSAGGFWGCLGQVSYGADQASQLASRLFVYKVQENAGQEGAAKIWEVPKGKTWLTDAPVNGKFQEKIEFGFPSLSQRLENGLVVWRRREITGGSPNNPECLSIYELLRWRPSGIQTLEVYCELRSSAGQMVWVLGKDHRIHQQLYIKSHPLARRIHFEPGPCAAISSAGEEILYVRNFELLYARLEK